MCDKEKTGFCFSSSFLPVSKYIFHFQVMLNLCLDLKKFQHIYVNNGSVHKKCVQNDLL